MVDITMRGQVLNYRTRNVRARVDGRHRRLTTLSDQDPQIEVGTPARQKAMSLADTVSTKLTCLNEEKGALRNVTPLIVIAWGIRGRITRVDMFGKRADP